MANERIRVGLMGLGRSGWDLHAAGLALMDDYEIVAAADPDPERRAEAESRFGCTTYADPDALLSDSRVELAVVATPSHTHVPLGIAALGAGKHVVVEKPMGQSTGDVDTLITAAEKADRIVTCFQNARFDPTYLAIREVIDSGRLGNLVLIRRALHRYARRRDWQTLRKFGGGELPNTASHILDQLLLLVGDGPVDLLADLRHTVSAGDAEDHVKLVLKPNAGPLIDIEVSSTVAAPQPAWFVAGTTGCLYSAADGLIVRWYEPGTLGELEVDEGAVPGRVYGTGERIDWQEETITPEPPGDERTVLFYQHLARTLRDGADLYVTPVSVRRQIEIIERARLQAGFL